MERYVKKIKCRDCNENFTVKLKSKKRLCDKCLENNRLIRQKKANESMKSPYKEKFNG